MSFDALIVGSGAAGVAAGLALCGRRTAIVDVGFEPPERRLDDALYALRERSPDLSRELLGEAFEGLGSLFDPGLNAKLKAPALRYVTRDAERLGPVAPSEFRATQSFARGGLANAWGAGAFRFDAADLDGFPIRPSDLAPFYARLGPELGVSGCDDDLAAFFDSAGGLEPALELDAHARQFLARYQRARRRLNAQGIFAGRARLAVASLPREDRPAYGYAGLDFFEPERPAVYTPARTLEALVRSGLVYLPNRLALRYESSPDRVRLHVRRLGNGETEVIECRRLLLAAGALGSARLALASNADHETRLPILDNPISFVPLLSPERIGRAQESRFFGGGLVNLVYRGDAAPEPVQGTFYGLSGILRSDFLMDLPLASGGIADAARHLASALAVLQLFYPDAPDPANFLRLTREGELEIHHRPGARGRVERVMIRALRRIGYLGLARLCRYPPPGSSIHYAGTLPMRMSPQQRYETDPDGRLAGAPNVYVCDSATFPRLPARNLTYTAMANAMRIATGVAAGLA